MDNLFIKGLGHNVCQDYSLTRRYGNKSIIILSDGCSNSKHTDVGSRILTYSAKKSVEEYFEHFNPDIMELNSKDIKTSVCYIIQDMSNHFSLDFSALDATLLIGIWDHEKKKGKVFCYGDGSVIWKTKNDTLNFINLSYESNAPYYLSYGLEESRNEDYIKSYGDKSLVLMEHVGHEVNRNICKYDKYCEFTFDDSTTMLAIASDGLNSFERNKMSIDISTIIDPFFAFKNVNGEYLKRRADKYIKDLSKDGFTHFDDISIACINIKD